MSHPLSLSAGTLSPPFMACDVRGSFPEQVNSELFERMGVAIGRVWPRLESALLAGDLRASTPELLAALGRGLEAPIRLRLQPVPTPLAYFVAREIGVDITLVVTASHNPVQYNGLKLLLRRGSPMPAELARLASETMLVREPTGGPEVSWAGDAPQPWVDAYIERLGQLAGTQTPLRLVVDSGNGCMAGIAARALRLLGHRVDEIHATADGTFPARGPDPTAPGALKPLRQAVQDGGVDLGVAFDGDGDRAVFVDGAGQTVAGDVIGAALAREASERSPGRPVVMEMRTSPVLRRQLTTAGLTVASCPPGHSLVREAMRQERASFAAETSGHYFFAELGHDDGLYAAMRLTGIVAAGQPLHELVRSYPTGARLPEVRVPFRSPAQPLFDALQERSPSAQATLEAAGLVLDWGDAWLLVRPSITEPLMTVRAEALTSERLEAMLAEVRPTLVAYGMPL